MDATKTKEQIHDEQISPLVRQIIRICQDNGIAMFANFAIPTEDKPGLQCSSMIPDETGVNPKVHQLCHAVVHCNPGALMAAVTIAQINSMMGTPPESDRPALND